MAQSAYSLAVSSIAWDHAQDGDVVKILADHHVTHVELAPTKIWPDVVQSDPSAVTDQQISEALTVWWNYGVEPVAMQSMLFLRPELTIFENEAIRAQTSDYLKKFIELSDRMGIKRMIFGSPKNRIVPENLTTEDAWTIALEFFRNLGDHAEKHGVIFCIEPNPTAYNCNFVTNAIDGAQLVREVNHPGFGLHLDAAGMMLAGDTAQAVLDSADILRHFHISAPYLGSISEDDQVPHADFADALRQINYDQTVSIEMRPGETPEANLASTQAAVQKAQTDYAL